MIDGLEPLQYYKWMWRDWRANRRIQKMHYIAQGFYRSLLDEQWAEGSLPNEEHMLADICGCPLAVFQQYWPEITPCFHVRPDGRYINIKMEKQRTELDSKRVKLADAGRVGGLKKISVKQSNVQQLLDIDKQLPKQSRAEQSNEEQSLVPPSRHEIINAAKTEGKTKSADERHTPFRESLSAYWLKKNPELDMPWDGAEARQLSAFLKTNPQLTLEKFRVLLNARARSDVNHSERIRVWIGKATDYLNGPLDVFGKPKSAAGGGHKHEQQRELVTKNRNNLADWATRGSGNREAHSGSQISDGSRPALEQGSG